MAYPFGPRKQRNTVTHSLSQTKHLVKPISFFCIQDTDKTIA